MRTLLAVLLPSVSLLLQGKIFQAILCVILQITLIGWIPAAFWAVSSLNNARQDKQHQEILNALNKKGAY